MTPADKQKLWNALYKCTRNGYPGATYEAHDKPTDPRVRGGRWNWKQRDLRALFDQLVVYGDNNQPTAAWRELEKYKTKIAPACLRNIYQAIVFGPSGPTFYILAENGDILTAENGDRLIQE